jgi:hypothetical protein
MLVAWVEEKGIPERLESPGKHAAPTRPKQLGSKEKRSTAVSVGESR